MAGLFLLQRGQSAFSRRIIPTLQRRMVSTSKKSNDTAAIEALKTEVKKEEQNWISYGFDMRSKEGDRSAMHSIFFTSVTLCLVVVGFYLAYLPDHGLRNWAWREAFLELRRREKLGLPPIDPNLIDPAKIDLPTDEELGDTEIVI